MMAATVVAVAWLAVGGAGQARATDDPVAVEAKRHYEEGTKAFNLGEYPRAIAEFKAAYNAKPDPLLLYNIGQSFRLGGDAAQALFFYKSFLRNMANAPNRKEVEGRIRTLEKLVEEQKNQPPAVAAAAAPAAARKEEPPPVPAPPAPVLGAPSPPAPSQPAGSPVVTPISAPAEKNLEPSPAGSPPPFVPLPPTTTTSPVPVAQVDLALGHPPPETAAPRPIYRRWWFWTGIGVVALLAVVAAAAQAKANQAPSSSFGLYGDPFK
jgi:hypothetical protein